MKMSKKLIFEIGAVLLITATVILGGFYVPTLLLGAKFNNVDDYSSAVKIDVVQPYGEDTLALESRIIEMVNLMSDTGVYNFSNAEDYRSDMEYFGDLEKIIDAVRRNYSVNIIPESVQRIEAGDNNDIVLVSQYNENSGIDIFSMVDSQNGIVLYDAMSFEAVNLKYTNFWSDLCNIYSQGLGMTFLDSGWDTDGTSYNFHAVTVDGRLTLNMDMTARPQTYTENSTSYYTYSYYVNIYLSEK